MMTMEGAQYEQSTTEDGLPYIRSADNQQFYVLKNPVSANFIPRMGAAAVPPNFNVNNVLPSPNGSSVSSTKQSGSSRLALDKKYLLSWYNGIPRVVLIIALAGAWISAACIRTSTSFTKSTIISQNVAANPFAINSSFSDFEATRYAFLIIAIIAFIVSLFEFLINSLGVVQLKRFKCLDWAKIFAITDIIFLVALLILSIVSAVRESQLQNQSILVNSIDIRSYYNLGSFASAAFFGLLSCIIYIVLIVAWVILHQRKRRHNKVNNSRQSNKSQITNVNNIDTTISSDFDAKHRYEIRETPVNPERQFSEEI